MLLIYDCVVSYFSYTPPVVLEVSDDGSEDSDGGLVDLVKDAELWVILYFVPTAAFYFMFITYYLQETKQTGEKARENWGYCC